MASFSSLFALLQTFKFGLDILLMREDDDNKLLQHILVVYEVGRLIAKKKASANELVSYVALVSLQLYIKEALYLSKNGQRQRLWPMDLVKFSSS